MDTINKLTELFAQFPGIGPRQARRFVYYLLIQDRTKIDYLSYLIVNLRKEVRICELCYRFFIKGSASLCQSCARPDRDHSLLMIVASDSDLDAMEKSHAYEGYYFVLGGLVPILEQEPEKMVRLNELYERIERETKAGALKEIIFALSANAEGDYTADFIRRDRIGRLAEASGVKISLLGRGLSTGTELEYSDSDTLKNALNNRH
ncbi:MAG: toprim domain-containing protein [Patescibacteria group bacterium]